MLEIDITSLAKAVDSGLSALGDIEPVFANFASYMTDQTEATFDALAHGGTFRGVSWPAFSTKYKRRPSGAPVTASSNLLVDTGRLKEMATSPVLDGNGELSFRTNLDYASIVAKRRPFLFFEIPQDLDKATELADQFINQE